MSELKLLNCPFCGSTKLKIEKKSKLYGHMMQGRVEQHTFSVRCNVCHARGGAIGGKTIDIRQTSASLPEWIVTDEELKEKAVEAWNTRKPMQNIVERLRENAKEPMYQHHGDNYYVGIYDAIEIVKEEGGPHEQTGQENKDNSC